MLLIGSGTKDNSVYEISRNILDRFQDLASLQLLEISDLVDIKGISTAKALLLCATIELSKRISNPINNSALIIDNPIKLKDWLNKEIGHLKQEHFIGVFLDNSNKFISHKILFIGTLNISIVHPRELFSEAIKHHAAKIIIAHNHPSGCCEPSNQDLLLTKKLLKVSYVVGIPIIDHIIIGKNNYVSLRAQECVGFED